MDRSNDEMRRRAPKVTEMEVEDLLRAAVMAGNHRMVALAQRALDHDSDEQRAECPACVEVAEVILAAYFETRRQYKLCAEAHGKGD